jgi:adenylate cyclase
LRPSCTEVDVDAVDLAGVRELKHFEDVILGQGDRHVLWRLMSSLTPEQLADRAGLSVEQVERMTRLGLLTRTGESGQFRPGDIYRLRLLVACERSGLPLEAVARAVAAGKFSLSFMDSAPGHWPTVGTKTYREVAEELRLPLDETLDLVRSLGYRRPSPDDRIREEDPQILTLFRLSSQWTDVQAFQRSARMYVDALRRIADAELARFDRYFLDRLLRQGLTFAEAMDVAVTVGREIVPLQEQLLLTLYRRQQQRRWTEYLVEGIEGVVEEMGLRRRAERPPAFGFVDLAGYTALTEERGDEAGADLAGSLAQMVDTVAAAHGGQPVKMLGDGVMVYFRQAGDAVSATLEMVRRAPDLGLPAHAGVAAGRAVFQDGDYFGRVVNRAARIAEHAAGGQTLVSGEVAELAGDLDVEFRKLGPITLEGFSGPVEVYEAVALH